MWRCTVGERNASTMAGAVHLVDVTKELELKPQRPVCDSASIHVKKATKLSSADGTVSYLHADHTPVDTTSVS